MLNSSKLAPIFGTTDENVSVRACDGAEEESRARRGVATEEGPGGV